MTAIITLVILSIALIPVVHRWRARQKQEQLAREMYSSVATETGCHNGLQLAERLDKRLSQVSRDRLSSQDPYSIIEYLGILQKLKDMCDDNLGAIVSKHIDNTQKTLCHNFNK